MGYLTSVCLDLKTKNLFLKVLPLIGTQDEVSNVIFMIYKKLLRNILKHWY